MENFKKEKVSLWRRIAALALAAALALGLAACDASAVVPGSSTPTVSTAQPAGDGQTANFEMYFLDVGQALSVLVECDGQYMLYDGGNVDDGSYVVSYLQNLGVEELQYVFCSHAHEDHVGGLSAALAYFPADHVYSPVTEASTKCFQDFVKYTGQQGLQVEVPAAGTVWPLGSATVTMLGPVAQYDNTNDTSIVLRVDYGSTSFLLTGDMESDAEDEEEEETEWEQISQCVEEMENLESVDSGPKDKKKAAALDRLEELFDKELLDILLPAGTTISQNAVSLKGIPSASKYQNDTESSDTEGTGLLEAASRQMAVNAYVPLYFSSFLKENESEPSALRYEMEYLLAGKKSDRENLKDAVNQVLTLRGAMNLLFLLNSPDKKAEADKLRNTDPRTV